MEGKQYQPVFGTKAKQKLLMLQISSKLKVFMNTLKVLFMTAMTVR